MILDLNEYDDLLNMLLSGPNSYADSLSRKTKTWVFQSTASRPPHNQLINSMLLCKAPNRLVFQDSSWDPNF